ncbi:taste receptor type 2 member 39-like [Lissotriton helveticus]
MSPDDTVNFIFTVIALVSGLMGNMFILSVNFIGWIKRRSDLSSCDLIICSLALSNLSHVGLYFAISFNFFRSLKLINQEMNIYQIYAAMLSIRSCSFWFCTWFCLYCYVKIETFTRHLVIRLVKIFLQRVPWLLVASVLVSLAISLLSAFNYETQPGNHILSYNSSVTNLNISYNGSLTILSALQNCDIMNNFYFNYIQSVFSVFLSVGVAILIMLCRHMKHMRQNADGFRSPSMKPHLGAVKTITFLLLLYSTYYVVQFIVFRHYPLKGLEMLYTFVDSYFPILNSIILIQGIAKLWKTLTEIFHLAFCCGKETA